MNYNLRPVKYFVDVVQTHGFSSAARRNYVSETAISTAIRNLEEALGHQLLNRQGGAVTLTPTGKQFYARATRVLASYAEIWRHPDPHAGELLRLHFLTGFAADAATLAAHLPETQPLSFDEELLADAISRLLDHDYDVLVGFSAAFANNPKLRSLPLRQVSFALLFNEAELEAAESPQALAAQSKLYLQHWHSTGIQDIQDAALAAYLRSTWSYAQIAEVNSFAAAAVSVNFKGGFALVPTDCALPASCTQLTTVTPAHLHHAFSAAAAISADLDPQLAATITKAATLSYHG